MKLEFEQLTLSSFKSFDDGDHTVHFENLKSGLHFMRGINKAEPRLGSNGAGKSSIWDALTWALYGKTVSGLKNTDITPWGQRKKTASVMVHIRVDDEPHVVQRTVGPNRLMVDDKDSGAEDVSSLIGLSFELFANTILLGQGEDLFFDLKPSAKMQLFVDVLELDRWDRLSGKASSKVGLILQDQAEVQGELTGTRSTLDSVQAMLTIAQERGAEWDGQRQVKLKGHQSRLKELTKVLSEARKNLTEADTKFDMAQAELRAIRGSLIALNESYTIARSDVSAETARLNGLESQAKGLERDLALFGKTDDCPVCGQKIKGTKIETHKKELRAKIAILQGQVEIGVPLRMSRKVKSIKQEVDDANAQVDDFTRKSDEASSQVSLFRPRVSNTEAEINSLEKELTALEKSENPYQDQISTLKKRRMAAFRKQEELEAESRTLARRLTRVQFWIKGFKDIRLFVIEEVLQQLELTTNSGLEEIGLLGWQVKYSIEKETKAGGIHRGLSVLILSPSNKDFVRWESWSGGEGQRLRLVGALALSEVLLNYAGVWTNLEILDEPTRGLSTEGVKDLCDFLADRAKDLKRITYFIDHMSIESARFASVLTVTKDKNGTHL